VFDITDGTNEDNGEKMIDQFFLTTDKSKVYSIANVEIGIASEIPDRQPFSLNSLVPIIHFPTVGKSQLIMARWGIPSDSDPAAAPFLSFEDNGNPRWNRLLDFRKQKCVIPVSSFRRVARHGAEIKTSWYCLDRNLSVFGFVGVAGEFGGRKTLQSESDIRFSILTRQGGSVSTESGNESIPIIVKNSEESLQWMYPPYSVIKEQIRPTFLERDSLDDFLRFDVKEFPAGALHLLR